MNTTTLKKGTTIFWEGDPGSSLYHILSGRVGVFKDYATIRQKKLAELGPGDYFGEMGLIDGAPRSATAVALEGTKLERINEPEFGLFLAENPDKVDLIIRQLSHRLRQTTQDYLEVCQSIARMTAGSDDVSDEMDYHFAENEHLRSIHDRQAASRENA